MNEKEPLQLLKATDCLPVVILAGGDYPQTAVPAGLLDNAAKVICCDGAAAEFIANGGEPFAIVGDCDSLPDNIIDKYSGIIYRDPDQEYNDQTKAVKFCISQGFEDLVILGSAGKREDHTLGNLGLLPDYIDFEGVKSVRAVTEYGQFDMIRSTSFFESYPGQQVSIICMDPGVAVTTMNLRFPLHEAVLTRWWQGTLNESLGDIFGFITTGKALVFRLITDGSQ